MFVGEEEFDAAEGVARAGFLPQAVVGGAGRAPVHRAGSDDAATDNGFKAAVKGARIAAQFVDFVFFHDGRRHGPGRAHHDVAQFVGKRRGLAVTLADNGAGGIDFFVAAIHFHVVGGDVDEDVAFAHVLRHPAQALHVDHQTVGAGIAAAAGFVAVQQVARFAADDAVRLEAVALLVGGNGFCEGTVKVGAVTVGGRRAQFFTQDGNGFVAHALFEGDFRQRLGTGGGLGGHRCAV